MRPRRLDMLAVAEILGRQGPDAVTMARVAAHLGVAKPTLFKLAGSKDALVRACVEAEAERVLGHLHAADSGPPVATLVRGLKRYAAESPGGFRLLFEHSGVDARRETARIAARVRDRLRLAGGDLVAVALLAAAAAIVANAPNVDPDAIAAELQAGGMA